MKGILTWHSIDDSGSVISVSRLEFERQLDAISRRGIPVVPLEDLVLMEDDEDAIAFTFDDGFENFATVAAPLLASKAMPATIFAVTGHVGGHNDWPAYDGDPAVPSLPLMTWDTLRSLAQQGFSIGSHSVHHRRLASVGRATLLDELVASKSRIEREIGIAPVSFAFPYGSLDSAAVSETAKLYRIACTTRFAPLESGATVEMLPRLDAYYFRDASLLEAWGTARFRTYVAMRRAGRAVRRALRLGR